MFTLGEISLLKIMYPEYFEPLLTGTAIELGMVQRPRVTIGLLLRVCKEELFLTDPLGVWNI